MADATTKIRHGFYPKVSSLMGLSYIAQFILCPRPKLRSKTKTRLNEDQRTHAEADKLHALYDLLGSDWGSV
jgi:hypothetical protein